jgi:hypothetical protein
MEFLYHYTNATAAKKILDTQQLKFGHVHRSNDPFEILSNRYSHLDFPNKKSEDYMLKLDAYIKREMSFGCFGIDASRIRGDEKWTMWAHYANNHKGACLVFNKWKLLSKIKEQIKSPLFHYINYTNSFRLHPNIFDDNSNKSIESFIKKFQTPLLFTKHEDWEVENEFRIVVLRPDFSIPVIDCINRVILGPEISTIARNEIKNIAKLKYQSLTVGELQYNSNSYIRSLNLFLSDTISVH